MKHNPLKNLEKLGQSLWLDYIQRSLLTSGKIKRFITDDGLRGITSNPSIFEKAITESTDYDTDIQKMKNDKKKVVDIYEALTEQDVRDAADQLRPLYDEMDGKDDYVSLEVNPHLAYDTQGTIEEARRLWTVLNRPNVMIKVPATNEGLPAIQQLISEGININITLLFGLPRYQEVANAYISGLESRVNNGKSIENIASVASFFLSRIDVCVDLILEEMITQNSKIRELAKKVHGQVAIASAKIAYKMYENIYSQERFKKLISKGARPQRLLWASTSTKNPTYSDIKYIEALIGSETINTVPLETLNAYRDHGDPKMRLEQGLEDALQIFKQLSELNIDIDSVTNQLLEEGINKFNQAFDQLIEAIKGKL